MRKALALIEDVHKVLAEGEDKEFMAKVVEFLNHNEEGMKRVDDLIPFLKTREIKQWSGEGGKGRGKAAPARGKGKAEQKEADRVVLNLALGMYTTLETHKSTTKYKGMEAVTKLRSIIVKQLQEQEGELCSGTAPASALERIVQRDLSRLSRRT